MARENDPVLVQDDLFPHPVEERIAEFFFRLCNQAAQSRLCDEEFPGGAGNVFGLCDVEEILDIFYVHGCSFPLSCASLSHACLQGHRMQEF